MIYAIDTETSGLNFYLGDRAFMMSKCTYDMKSSSLMFGQQSLSIVQFEMMNRDNQWVFHNACFDIPFLGAYGLSPAGQIHDTMIAAHVYDPTISKALKFRAKHHLGRENPEEQKLEDWFNKNGMRGKDSRQYIMVPEEIIVPYAKADVEMTMALFKFFQEKGVIDDPVYKMEMRVLPVVVDIVRQGMRVDKKYVTEQAVQSTAKVCELQLRATKEHGVENLGSNDQVADALFNKAGLTCLMRTDKGNPCLDEVELAKYNHPLVEMVSSYRELVKLNSTYLQPMMHKTDKDDILHASLNQVGARTGRFSSSNPNIQNIPRSGGAIDIRRGFITKPGHRLLLVDLSQIEIRVLAHYCKEPVLLETLKDRQGDIHGATAKVLFDSAEKKFRTVAKTLNFATIYGAGSQQIADSLNKALPDQNISVGEAAEFKRQYFKGYPMVQQFLWDVQNEIRKKGYVYDVYGRKYPCEADVAYRGANYLIQGCSALLAKKTMTNLYTFLKPYKSRLCNIIHDEFLIDLHNDEDFLIEKLVAIIEDHHEFRVPIYANAAISSTSWAEKKDLA